LAVVSILLSFTPSQGRHLETQTNSLLYRDTGEGGESNNNREFQGRMRSGDDPAEPYPGATAPHVVPSDARSSIGGRAMEGKMADAMEHCRFAIRALEFGDADSAAQKLRGALQKLT
ncbi:unnamed protein product, partial [Ectocarpus sp. 4 AP-2014]